MSDIVKRKLLRAAYCRGCDKKLPHNTEVISTFSHRNRGQHIYFCLSCSKSIGELVTSTKPIHNPIIWGDGWYALLQDKNVNIWYVSPKKFFEENGYCMDGWEGDFPDGMTDEEFDLFIAEHGYEPEPPKGFYYCVESGMRCHENWTIEEQKNKLREAGFLVDNVPKWGYDRK